MNVLAAAKLENLKLDACMEDPFASGDQPKPDSGAAMKSAQKVKSKIMEAHDALKQHAANYADQGGNMGAQMHLNNATSHLQDAFHSVGKADTAHQFAAGQAKK